MVSSKAPPRLERLSAGNVFHGRYEVLCFIGSGGFAQVYQCRDLKLNRDVALKIFWPLGSAGHDPAQYAQLLERFRREANAASRVQHPNMVGIYDVQITDDTYRPYIVMECLRGHDLAVELKRHGALSPARTLRLLLPTLEALGEAHRLGIVHKDLKPSNLFMSEPGTAQESLRILDFGVAHMGEEKDARITRTGHAFGTPGYLAPEYIQSQTVTPALDVYQMALILVEMLSGQRVVNDDNPLNCIMIHGMGKLELPTALMQSPLGPVLSAALQKDFRLRITDALAFADALQAIHPSDVPSLGGGRGSSELSMISGNVRSVAAEGAPPDTGGFSVGSHTVPIDSLSAISSSSEVRVNLPGASVEDDESDPTLRGLDLSEITSALEVELENLPGRPRPRARAVEPAASPPLEAPAEAMQERRFPLLAVSLGIVGLLGVLVLISLAVVAFSDTEPAAPELVEASAAPLAEAPPGEAPPGEMVMEEMVMEDAPAELLPVEPAEEGSAPVIEARMVSIVSTPPGARVFIEQRSFGTTPLVLQSEELGEAPNVEVRLELEGYTPQAKLLTADLAELRVELVPLPEEDPARTVTRRAPVATRRAVSRRAAPDTSGIQIAQ